MSMRLSRSIVGEAEAEAVHRVICEDGYLGIGKEVQQFEADVAAYLGVPASWVISVNTGTAALHLAVEAVLGHGSGAEVLVPSLTFVASFQAIGGAGAVPVACDARLDTATIDLADAERRLTPRTKAIMPVHYASNPVDLDGVYAFAESTACGSSKMPPMRSDACTRAARSAASGMWPVSALTASRTSPAAKAAAS